ncbi:MAG: phenol hydroxylase subunit P4 [Pseudomonadota bacterium]|nr:phenol hydroxylase subunit P4 [Pseudomonadota bacterium]
MPVKSIGSYDFAAKDTADKFPAPLLFFGWEDHKMFCSPMGVPFPPTMKFGEMCQGAFAGIFGAHPDFAKINWSEAEWFKSGQPWQPDMDKTLAENGLGHKDVIRFRTPGLMGLGGSAF